MDFNSQKPNESNRNLLIAVLVSALVLVGADYVRLRFFPAPVQQVAQTQQGAVVAESQSPGAPAAPMVMAQPVQQAIKTVRLPLQSSTMEGGVALEGARIDQLVLPRYKNSVSDQTPVTMFTPSGDPVFFFEAGWQGQGVATPTPTSTWTAETPRLSPDTPLVLTWKNDQGLTFQRTYELADDSYTIHVTDMVSNDGSKAVTIGHFAQLHRGMGADELKKAEKLSTFTHPVGPELLFDSNHIVHNYKDLLKNGSSTEVGRNGWAGISTPYFLAALIPDQSTNTSATFRTSNGNGKTYFSLDMQEPEVTIQPGAYVEKTYRLFAGPKVISLLQKEGVGLEQAVDYGWYHVIAKMFYSALMFMNNLLGNLGLAIIVTTLLIKVALWPLAAKSYRAMSELKKLQPKMEQVRAKYGDQREKVAAEMMALYRQHKVNPASGCWPVLIQIPIFFAFYKVILISIEFRQAPFFGWIVDLSSKDPLYVLPILMGITMFVQQRLNPPAADPVQQKVMQMMPILFTFMFMGFPSGLVLYWTTNSLLSLGQQYLVMRRMGLK